ncbi:Metallo-dependent phosphatase [Dacryopinax primogenitus]|uniref:Metallo-dependent phosphatase n=1 Tax=Dacryopinax primogenitus (strain DJM 731) TaxID=1858805 RepID=M5GE18_DACPD|nr:Metallo-dependent phosphatase [Dacryopinax primogenitus]EJU05007.1 Metallo-dependent phosphatase [Dacryopinax primogenitus]
MPQNPRGMEFFATRSALFMILFSCITLYLIFRAPTTRADRQLVVHHEPIAASYTKRIVAVGDLHGDLKNAMKVLRMSGVIDGFGDWSGDVDVLVQTGDIIDRGDDTIVLFKYLDVLRGQALAKGGTILSMMGNHEWMNVIGDWRYVLPSEIKTFGSVEARQHALSHAGWLGSTFWANYTLTTRLPMHPMLGPPNTDYTPLSSIPASISHSALSFVHGGLSPSFSFLTPYPSRPNALGRSLLHKLLTRYPHPLPHPPNPYPGLPPDATPEEHELYGGDGPLWYRGWALGTEREVCGHVDDVLHKLGVRRLIMGHTPTFTNIVSRCGGRIIIIDTGISHAYGGVLSALSIRYSLTPNETTYDDETGTQEYIEREVVSAVYEWKNEVLHDDRRIVRGWWEGWAYTS